MWCIHITFLRDSRIFPAYRIYVNKIIIYRTLTIFCLHDLWPNSSFYRFLNFPSQCNVKWCMHINDYGRVYISTSCKQNRNILWPHLTLTLTFGLVCCLIDSNFSLYTYSLICQVFKCVTFIQTESYGMCPLRLAFCYICVQEYLTFECPWPHHHLSYEVTLTSYVLSTFLIVVK